MHYLTQLNQTVNASLGAQSGPHGERSGRIGTPVFVRWTASVAASNELLNLQLAEMTLYTNQWLGATLSRLYATGTQRSGHLSLSLEYATGTSVLLALTLAHNQPYVSLAIYGTHGALYHNDYIIPARDGDLSPLPLDSGATSDAAPTRQKLLAAIEQSLALHQPVDLMPVGGRP